MKLVSLFAVAISFSFLSACSGSDDIYGSWNGKSEGKNSYSIIGEEPPEKVKKRRNLSPEYTRDVDLILSKEDCKIAFNFEDPVDCIYDPKEKVIVIPLWRDKNSISDSGLVITKLDDQKLELVNEFTRKYTDNFDYNYEMKGTETYSLNKND
nr:hypothetical protein [uncultured Methylophaga sp.]